jgi:hypothetical protein
MRDGIDYEFTIVLDIDIKHFAKASKDRTNLFMDKPEFIITPDIGKRILAWCNEGQVESENLKAIINHHPISMNHGSSNGAYARQAYQ